MPELRLLLFLLLTALAASPLMAQPADDPFIDPPQDAAEDVQARRARQPAKGDDTPPSAGELVRRSDETLKTAAETHAALGEKPAALAKAEAPLRIVPQEMHLGSLYGRRQGRYLALDLWLVNTGRAPVTVQREAFRLATRGREMAPGGKPEQAGMNRLQLGRRVVDVSELDKKGPVTVPPGEAVRLPVAFYDLPGMGDVPEMTLRVPVGDKTVAVDLNEYALGLLRLGVERVGPKGLLGIVTIRGEITQVGAGSLVEALETLAANQATRVVIAWADGAPTVNAELSTWLAQSAARAAGQPLNDRQHPILPGSIRELHLAKLPDGTGVPGLPGPQRVHATVAEAVQAALGSAYDALPVEELLREIESGHPLTRPAAVAAGGRLPDDKLPLLLKLTGDADVEVAKAAVHALREFGTPEAVGRLVELAKTGPEPVRFAAVESLAASRFAVAHEALRGLLDASASGPPVIPAAALVPVLAKYPRPLFGDALDRLATAGDPEVRSQALEALAKLGHPDLTAAFEKALADENEGLRSAAFRTLSRRRDAASEDLALRFTLHHLESAPPTREMYGLLQRTKDPRAVPLLLRHLDGDVPSRSELIRLLSQVGGLEVREALEAAYPRLERPVQPITLVALAQMRSPKFYEFAAGALRSNDAALINTASQQLQADGGPEAVALLVAALSEGTQPVILSNAASGLAVIGTPEARAALKKAYRSDNEQRARFAYSGWLQILQQSPGFEAWRAGAAARERDDWKQAVEKYSEAVELDPQFVEAWSGRANAEMQLGEHSASRRDYEKVLELDSGDDGAVTCLGILRVYDGRVDEGLAFVRDRAAGFEKSDLFAYNTACLYAVASEKVEAADPARADRLRADAVKELSRSVTLADPIDAADWTRQVEWMQKDPDLKTLHDRTDFKQVVAEAGKKVVKATKPAGK